VAILAEQLGTSVSGLSSAEAARRLPDYLAVRIRPRRQLNLALLLLSQFKSPLTLILIVCACLSLLLHDSINAVIILVIIAGSGLLGFWQEYGASRAVERLLATVHTTVRVLRDRSETDIAQDQIIPGDVIRLSAGGMIPGDCLLLESKDLFVDEASLTGESYPVEKHVGVLAADSPLAKRSNSVFYGTHVISGTATALVISIGRDTDFGKISERLKLRPAETEFESGIRRFGYFLLEVTVILVIAIFALNVYLERPVLESILFSLALAVGLTPQLLPAIISVNLAHGAKRMAGSGVVVRRLASIENFGSMDVLCSDKTGTLTEGIARVEDALDPQGKHSEKVLLYAFINASLESGFTNPIDAAVRACGTFDISHYQKLDEIPYDFSRRRLTVLVAREDESVLISKGALDNILDACGYLENVDGSVLPIGPAKSQLQDRYQALSQRGFRTLGVAYRNAGTATVVEADSEADMVFLGFLVLRDTPKEGIAHTVQQLASAGVTFKMITGDSRFVAAAVGGEVGLSPHRILTGSELRHTGDRALLQRVEQTEIFAEVEPNQKERIVLALKKAGHVVGYLGDGINDVSALHAADVGISVDQAADVAKEAADIVLMKHDLAVLLNGMHEGRTTFANTLKYVFMATSANFGNMFSMAGASIFLPFLPLLPKQILVMNLMTDLPEMTIATDRVDAELTQKPRRWNVPEIRRFMLLFGTLSSVFDCLTFLALLLYLRSAVQEFRTAWFLESVSSASLVVLSIRTPRSILSSKPSGLLVASTLVVCIVAAIVPATPLGTILGFKPLPLQAYSIIAAIVLLYLAMAEGLKAVFYRRLRH